MRSAATQRKCVCLCLSLFCSVLVSSNASIFHVLWLVFARVTLAAGMHLANRPQATAPRARAPGGWLGALVRLTEQRRQQLSAHWVRVWWVGGWGGVVVVGGWVGRGAVTKPRACQRGAVRLATHRLPRSTFVMPCRPCRVRCAVTVELVCTVVVVSTCEVDLVRGS